MGNRGPVSLAACLMIIFSGLVFIIPSTQDVTGDETFDPTAEWFFDEGSGQIAKDNTGNDNHLYLGGSTNIQSSDPSWGEGKNGSCLNMDGLDDMAQCDDDNKLDLTGEFTLESWFNTTSSGTYLALMDKRQGTNTPDGYTFYLVDGKPRLSLYYGTSSESGILGYTDLRDGKWHHLVLTCDGSTVTIYIDSEVETTKSVAGSPSASSIRFTIGMRSSGWGGYMNFQGKIDQCAVFDRALIQEEVEERYAGKKGKHSFWPMNEGTDQEVKDVISTNHGYRGSDKGVDPKDPEWYHGCNRSGLRFDGDNDMLTMGKTDLDIGSTFTISMWIWADSVTAEQDLLTHERMENGTRISYFRFYLKDSRLNAEGRWDDLDDADAEFFPDGSGNPFTSLRYVPRGRWSHVALVHNDGDHRTRFYIDGSVAGSIECSFPMLLENPEWMMGNSKSESYPFKGCLDEVHMMNYAINGTTVDYIRSSITVNERVPGIPENLRARSGDGFVEINWSRPEDIGTSFITGYSIYRSIGDGPMEQLSFVNELTFVFNDTQLKNGVTYRYRLKATNIFGSGDYSPWVSATPFGLPSEPRNLNIKTGDSYCQLTWSPPFNDGGAAISTYTVFRDQGNGWIVMTNLPGDCRKLNDTGLTNGVEYTYALKASNMIGRSPMSVSVKGTPLTVPDPPLSLEARPGDAFVQLEWLPPEDNGGTRIFAYHILKRSSVDKPFSVLWTLTEKELKYNDTDVENGETYQYMVRSYNMMGGSKNSNLATAKPMSIPSRPRDPEIRYGDSYLALTWKAPEDHGGDELSGYVVQRRTDGDWNILFEINPDMTDINDTTVTNGVTYSYRILALNSVGPSEFSSVITEIPRTFPDPPAVTSLVWGDSFIHLFWEPPGDDGGTPLTSYHVVRILSTRDYEVIAELDASITDYNHTSLINGRDYNYAIKALNKEGSSRMSRQMSGRPLTTPGAVMNLTSISGNGFVLIRWSPPEYDGGSGINGYSVLRYISGQTEPVRLANLGSGARDYNDTGVDNGRSYRYHVIARNEIGPGDPGVEVLGEPKEEDGSSLTFIILGTIFLVVFIVILISLFLMLLRLKRKKNEGKEEVPKAPDAGPSYTSFSGDGQMQVTSSLGPSYVPPPVLPGPRVSGHLPPSGYSASPLPARESLPEVYQQSIQGADQLPMAPLPVSYQVTHSSQAMQEQPENMLDRQTGSQADPETVKEHVQRRETVPDYFQQQSQTSQMQRSPEPSRPPSHLTSEYRIPRQQPDGSIVVDRFGSTPSKPLSPDAPRVSGQR